ncbi:MAG TPA: orotate phosphoribosyltransferase [Acidobacteriota bacterium]|nr:orotate phosphoribosyltransferase [Acidobacteriota bacterium]
MTTDEILKLFKDSGALLSGHFKLSSGRHSDVYYEKFTLLKNPTVCTRMCRELADQLAALNADTVVGPTTGGIIIAYDVARYLGIESIYAEPGEHGRIFKRGFSLARGQKVIIVDDVMTTGRSVFEVIDLVKTYEADIVAVGELLDRSGGTVSLDYPFHPLATVAADSWAPEECPLCARGEALTQRGSRKF